MTIVSMSLPDPMIEQMEEIEEAEGFVGRSELMRAALRLLVEDIREKNALKGHISAIIIVTHDESNEAPITRLKHEFEDIVKTHLHNKLKENNCVELFLLDGDAKKVSSLARQFQKEDKLKSVKLVIIG
jgi:CopG family transcriptional regulator, nickel-responsive regulator